MPSDSAPEMRPLMRNAQSPSLVGAPNEGALPPGAGGTGGASGDRPMPAGRGVPGIASGAPGGGSSARAGVAAARAARAMPAAMRRPVSVRTDELARADG